MDLHARNRRAAERGQRRLDEATPDEEREERDDFEPDYEQLAQDRAEARAMRGAW